MQKTLNICCNNTLIIVIVIIVNCENVEARNLKEFVACRKVNSCNISNVGDTNFREQVGFCSFCSIMHSMAASNRSSPRHDGPALKSPFVNAGTALQWESFPRSLCPWIYFTKDRGDGKGHTGEITEMFLEEEFLLAIRCAIMFSAACVRNILVI